MAKIFMTFASTLLCVAILASCDASSTELQSKAWTEADFEGVFDLSEIGSSLTVNGENLVLDGKVLPSNLIEARPHLTMGKDTNFLNLSDEAIDAMSYEAAHRLTHASPQEIREFMAIYNVTNEMLVRAWSDDQEVSTQDIRLAATELNEAGVTTLGNGMRTQAGDALLRDLGLDR